MSRTWVLRRSGLSCVNIVCKYLTGWGGGGEQGDVLRVHPLLPPVTGPNLGYIPSCPPATVPNL
eukprot:1054591-Prorocentrum_minimum.AAC.2